MRSAATAMDQQESQPPFPIVGIGVSAGGIEALTEFFRHTPARSGMAYVIVHQLSRQHQSLLTRILAQQTSMPVHEITDGMAVVVNQVFVTVQGPPLRLDGGRLLLSEAPARYNGQLRSLDEFLRSLAQQHKERAIAVILSGTGTYGTAGARDIKATGGLCIAQSPESAAFPEMPRSLIHAGFADQVLEPWEMPEVLVRCVSGARAERGLQDLAEDVPKVIQAHLRTVLGILNARLRRDFTGYRTSLVLRRIQRRMGLVATRELLDYATFLRQRPEEVAALADDLMISVTRFFRDPEAWDTLRASVIAPLCEAKRGEPLRVWVAACATGEEAYTLAILVAEEFRLLGVESPDVKIFATDLAEKPLVAARAGVFPAAIEADVSAELLERYFDKGASVYRIKKPIRDLVLFATHDLLRDPPFSRMDLCTCRNFLIYLETETQRRVIATLSFAVREGGHLFLGDAESCGEAAQQFEPVNSRWRIYRRTELDRHRVGEGFPALESRRSKDARSAAAPEADQPGGLVLLQRALLERFGPPTVVIDRTDQIVYFHGATDAYLQQPAGIVTRDLMRMLRPGLRVVVQDLLRAALRDNTAKVTQIESVEPLQPAGSRLEVTVEPVIPGKHPEYLLVSFRTLTAQAPELGQRPGADPGSHNEVQFLRQQLQTITEAHEASCEELRATNEEATSLNEELQSVIEELETSKEELRVAMGELDTVNHQLQAKIAESQTAADDMANLLTSSRIAMLFLDRELRVRRFTPDVTGLLRLIRSDIGRPITDIAPKFTDDNLFADARAVLDNLVPVECEVTSHTGRHYLRRVHPYRTINDRIDGVVITFINVDAGS